MSDTKPLTKRPLLLFNLPRCDEASDFQLGASQACARIWSNHPLLIFEHPPPSILKRDEALSSAHARG